MTDAVKVFSIAGGPLLRLVKKVTLEVRVVVSVRRQMSRMGYRVDSKRLRGIMYAPEFGSRLARSRSSNDPLVVELAEVIAGQRQGDMAAASHLRELLVNAVRTRLQGNSASGAFYDDRNEARTLALADAIENHTSDEVLFEHRLAEMHPIRARDIRELRQDWPGAAKWLGTVVTAQDRTALIKRWAAYPPDFSDASPAVFGILADLAADLPSSLGAGDAVAQFIKKGIERGIEPRAYWALRLANLEGRDDLATMTGMLEGHRGHPLVEATLHPDGAKEAISILEAWSPADQKEELHRSLLLGEYYIGNLKIDAAISLGKSTYEHLQSSGAAIQAARALVIRHMMHGSVANKNDLSEALLLAVRARADRRRWGIDSGPALALEIRVRRLLSDYEGALDLVNGSGEVPANEAELANPDVITETALLQAERGDVEIAKRLLSSVPAPRQSNLSAVIADVEGRRKDAAAFWAAAIEATDDLGEQTDLALQLSLHGVHSPTVIARLMTDNAEIAGELELVAALFGHEAGALEQFRGFANAKYRGALFLYIYLREKEDYSAAANWARTSGKRWGDPDLLIESALHFGRTKQYAEAIVDIRAALLAASDDWGGKRRAYRMLVESHSNAGDWNDALEAAAYLAAEEPNDPSATWALTICQIRMNNLDGALRSWQQHGSPEPRSEMEVGAWIELLAKFGQQVGTSTDALHLSTRYASNEQIRRALLGVFFLSDKTEDNGDDDGQSADETDDAEADPEVLAFQEMLANYLRDFPNGAIRQVAVDLEDPLASIREQFKNSPARSELDDKFAKGALPIGFAGEIYGKTYLEALLARDLGPVFSGSADTNAEEAAMIAAHEVGAVIDLSALVTLGRIPEEIRHLLSGHFPSVRALIEHQRDAMVASRTIARDSGLSYQPANGDMPEALHQRTPDQIANRAALAAEVESSFSRFELTSHAVISALPFGDLDLDKPFLLGADLSLALEVPFWADDTALKEVVRSEGGQPFGTPELLNHLRNEGTVDSGLIELAEATLVAYGFTGIRFRKSVWKLAESLAPSPAGLMNAIRHAGNDDAQERLQTALDLVDAQTNNPEILEGLIFATAQWLETIAPNDEAASQNLAILARALLERNWMTSSTLPYCVGAFRAVRGRADAVSILLQEIYRTFEAIAGQVSDEAAATAVFELVSRLDTKDGIRVRGAVLGRTFA